jgi:uncharacterized membrane protein YgdD (TMEM256/DUF423 family)
MNFLRLAGILGFIGVALGAFGAHGLRARVAPELLEVWKTGVLYQLVHALALLVVGLAGNRIAWGTIVGWLFVVGTVVFSGSLYALTLTGTRTWGAVTPFGGVAFLVGWVMLAVSARPG